MVFFIFRSVVIYFVWLVFFKEETSVFQQKAREDLATKSLELSKLTDSYDQLTRKIVHYKEQNTALQETIKEHQKIRTELEDKLKFEAKINQGYFSIS